MSETTNPPRFVQPDVVSSHFHIRSGDTVADFGAGSGYLLPALAEAVGEDGRLYACEIQKALVQRLGEQAQQAGWSQVSVVWCDIEAERGIPVGDAAVDIGVLVNTLFQLHNQSAALTEIDRVIRPGGKICVVDWSESFSGLGPADEQVMTKAATTALFEAQEYTLEQEFSAGEHHYGLSFRKS